MSASFQGTYSNSQSEDLGKYLHLLKPLRALADNWDIDVAAELSEYVDIIDRSQLTAPALQTQHASGDGDEEDFGSHSQSQTALDGVDINFAQAALLIQNSASIYSRKVQYLFNLTQETHHYIFSNNINKMNGGKSSKKNGAGADQDGASSDTGSGDGIEYQCLDDCLIQKDFAMKPQQSQDDNENIATNNLLPEISNLLNINASQTGNGKQSRELFSVAGESVGWMNEFDLFSCDVDLKGLPVTAFLKSILNQSNGARRVAADKGYEDVLTREAGFEMHVPHDAPFDIPADLNNDDYEHDDFPAAEYPEHIPEDGIAAGTNNEPEVATGMARYQIRTPVKKQPVEKKEFDFWKMLDPHEVTKGQKAFKKGKIGRAFNIIQKAIEAKSANVDLEKVDSVADFFAKNSESSVSKTQIPKEVLKKLKHPEFYAVYLKEQQSRQEFLKKVTSAPAAQEQQLSDNESPENEIFDIPMDNFVANMNFDDVPDNVSDQDDLANNDYADFHQEVQIEYELASGGSAKPSPVKSYKEMFSLHAYAAENLHFDEEAESEMMQRVKQWEERLVPILEEQNARPEYDIDIYRSKVHEVISGKVSKSADSVPFESLSEDVPRYDVSRYFLTLLHMANEGKVEIDEKPLSKSSNALEIRQVSFKLVR